MSRCRIIRAAQLAIVITLLAGGRAVHAEVTLGASFGYSHLSYPDTPSMSNDVVGIPGTQEWSQPGLRIGYHVPGAPLDLNADVGLVHVTRSGALGADETAVEALPQVQGNATGWGGFSPFVNAGVGVLHETVLTAYGASISATRAVFGGGFGVRKSVSDGHGFIRAELRFDHLAERVAPLGSADSYTFPATDLFSVKLGFDLLVAR